MIALLEEAPPASTNFNLDEHLSTIAQGPFTIAQRYIAGLSGDSVSLFLRGTKGWTLASRPCLAKRLRSEDHAQRAGKPTSTNSRAC